ncbi:MAG: glycosyltransferase family 4 protein [Ignavibacteria bacterium]|nr:glycosyltransferase family 4 protein [Ignavibacteria bacterium]
MLKVKKKIIITGSVPPPFHGSSVYIKNLLGSVLKDEFEIHHHNISDHRDLKNLSKLDLTNVKVAVKGISGMRSIVKKIKPDIVYIPVASNFLPFLRDGLMILTASKYSDANIIIHLHEVNYFRKVFYNGSAEPVKYFIRKSLSKVHTAIVYSNTLKINFEGFVNNITAFPNGADFPDAEKYKRIQKERDEKFVISYYANLYESKGILDLLNAAVILQKKNRNFELHIAGDYPDNESITENKAKEIISAGGIEEKVIFHGVVSGKEKEVFLRNTDILVHPTWYPYEGCPLAIIEAFAHGIPVISINDTGAIPEMIDDGVTGLLVEKKSPDKISEAVISLTDNKLLRESISAAAVKSYLKNFTAGINISNIITTFNKALN